MHLVDHQWIISGAENNGFSSFFVKSAVPSVLESCEIVQKIIQHDST